MTTPTVQDLFNIFTRVNADCAESGESVVPFDVVEYYADQICELFDVDEETGALLAIKLSEYHA